MRSRVLIAPLNWGLGHASRSIPVIQSFLDKDWEVILASDGDSLTLLQKEFPALPFYTLPGYNIRYPYPNSLLNAGFNARNFLSAVRKENDATQAIVLKEKPDLILSDNRYGVRSESVKSIFIGHQVSLRMGNAVLNRIGTFVNQKFIRRFDELWIPDLDGKFRLAGELSKMMSGVVCKYIGPLSRFEKDEQEITYDICAVLSGPEPQRSLLQDKLIRQLSRLDEQSVVILGKFNESKDYQLNESVRVISHATSEKLNELMNQSKCIVARAGYSTIMDLFTLGKKAILIPTPGQTEQWYLAKHLHFHPDFIFQRQQRLNIPKALDLMDKMDSSSRIGVKFDIDNYLF